MLNFKEINIDRKIVCNLYEYKLRSIFNIINFYIRIIVVRKYIWRILDLKRLSNILKKKFKFILSFLKYWEIDIFKLILFKRKFYFNYIRNF